MRRSAFLAVRLYQAVLVGRPWVKPRFVADAEGSGLHPLCLLRTSSFKIPSKGTGRTSARLLLMNETLPSLIENSFQIAWDYLEATGELGNPDTAARHLLDTIEALIRQGERRRLLLSNRSIASYQRFRAERGMCLAS